MPWKQRGSRQNTLSALQSCDSSSFPCEDPGDCLLSIHQRQWIGWAGTAATKPQCRARAVPPHRQRLWSWIVQNSRGWAMCARQEQPRWEQCSKCWGIAAGTASPGETQPPARELRGFWGCGGMERRDGVDLQAGTVCFALCGCGGVAGQCLLYVLCWTRAAGFGGGSLCLFLCLIT